MSNNKGNWNKVIIPAVLFAVAILGAIGLDIDLSSIMNIFK